MANPQFYTRQKVDDLIEKKVDCLVAPSDAATTFRLETCLDPVQDEWGTMFDATWDSSANNWHSADGVLTVTRRDDGMYVASCLVSEGADIVFSASDGVLVFDQSYRAIPNFVYAPQKDTAPKANALTQAAEAQVAVVVEESVEKKVAGEIDAKNGTLTVKGDGGEELFDSTKAVRYALSDSDATTLADMTINKLVSDSEQPTVTLVTSSVDGRAIDLVLDWTNGYEADATLQLANLSDVVLLGDPTDVFKLASGERALITFTQVSSTGGAPTFVIAKKVVG